jgi:hypothetical protein
MKTKIIGLLMVTVVVLGLGFAVTGPMASHAKAIPAAVPTPAPNAAAAAEPHPEIREAIASLRRAKEHMEHAAHDFGGHRVEALRATDDAIRQLEICLRFDKD